MVEKEFCHKPVTDEIALGSIGGKPATRLPKHGSWFWADLRTANHEGWTKLRVFRSAFNVFPNVTPVSPSVMPVIHLVCAGEILHIINLEAAVGDNCDRAQRPGTPPNQTGEDRKEHGSPDPPFFHTPAFYLSKPPQATHQLV
jgi:hypothetical protein